MSSGSVVNSNFTDNSTGNYSGAILIQNVGSVENCNFINYQVTDGEAGAIGFEGGGSLINCNFVNNAASNEGGAVFFFNNGGVENCNL